MAGSEDGELAALAGLLPSWICEGIIYPMGRANCFSLQRRHGPLLESVYTQLCLSVGSFDVADRARRALVWPSTVSSDFCVGPFLGPISKETYRQIRFAVFAVSTPLRSDRNLLRSLMDAATGQGDKALISPR
jgi:hypothetical protein